MDSILGSAAKGVAADALYAAQLQNALDNRPKRERRQPTRFFQTPEYQTVYAGDSKRKRGQATDDSDSAESESNDSTSTSEFDEDDADSLGSSYDSDASSDFDMTGRNDVSDLELMRDESGELVLRSRTQKQMRDILDYRMGSTNI